VQQAPPSLAAAVNSQRKQAPKPAMKKDPRVFLRATGAAAQNTPTAVRGYLNKLLDNSVKEVRKVGSGFSIVCHKDDERAKLLEKADKLGPLLGGRIKESTNWHTYIIASTPLRISVIKGGNWDKLPRETRRKTSL